MARSKKDDAHQDAALTVTHVVAYMLLNALLTGAGSERTVDDVTYNARVIDGETIQIVKATALVKLVTARDELRRAESRIAYLSSVINVVQGRPDVGGMEIFEASRKEKETLVERCEEYRATIEGAKEEIVLSIPVGEFPTLVVE